LAFDLGCPQRIAHLIVAEKPREMMYGRHLRSAQALLLTVIRICQRKNKNSETFLLMVRLPSKRIQNAWRGGKAPEETKFYVSAR
jgi:hypothetical protein